MKLSKIASELPNRRPLLSTKKRVCCENAVKRSFTGMGEPKNKTPINAVLTSAAKLTSGEVKIYAAGWRAVYTKPLSATQKKIMTASSRRKM